MNRTTGVLGSLAIAAALLLQSQTAFAQKPVSQGEVISETLTIEAINHDARIVTLKHADGTIADVFCGPEVKRFEALKVGDRITFRYHESLVTAVRRPDAAAKPAGSAAVTRTPGTKPGGTISQQMTAEVTIEAVDPKVPSVTIRSADGRRMSMKVQDAKNIAGLKAGDKVEVTYTQALAVSVESAK
jgi:Cu/Ag efflux protein CusF